MVHPTGDWIFNHLAALLDEGNSTQGLLEPLANGSPNKLGE